MTTAMAESTSRRPEKSRYEVPLRLDELDRLHDLLLALDEFLLQLGQERVGVLFLFVLFGSRSRSEPEETPRTAATTCNWLVPS